MSARLPRFAVTSRHDAPLLAILETPTASGAERSGETSLDNHDPSARFQSHALAKAGLETQDVVFWNMWAGYGASVSMSSAPEWAAHCQRLIGVMPRLKAVLVFGNPAWLAARRLNLDDVGPLIGAPHPSSRGRNSSPDAARLIEQAWERAARIIGHPAG